MDNRIYRALKYENFKWPPELDSGVMFFEGLRITRLEFESAKRELLKEQEITERLLNACLGEKCPLWRH